MSEAVLRTTGVAYAPPLAAEAVGAPAGPVQPQERIQLLDVLRGFALLGILQVNWPDAQGTLGHILNFFVDDKMRTIYSFLFGLGFAIQLIRAQERNRSFMARYAWRALLLLAIGSAHFVFIWDGDIVREYALMSFMLLLVSRARPWVVLVAAVALLALDVTPNEYLPGHGQNNGTLLMREDAERADHARVERLQTNESRAIYAAKAVQGEAGDGYMLLVRARAHQLREQLTRWSIYYFAGDLQLLSLFLLGLWVGRKRILHEPEKHTRLLTWTAVVGLTIGFVGNTYSAFGDWVTSRGIPWLSSLPTEGVMGNIEYEVGNYVLSLGYIALVALAVLRSARVRSLLVKTLAPVGRMGLTNYLMQSVILTMLLFGRGLGLNQYLPTWSRQAVLELVFVVQIVYSRWWFRHFQFGPVEWAWRSLTWWKVQPMRLVTTSSEVTAS